MSESVRGVRNNRTCHPKAIAIGVGRPLRRSNSQRHWSPLHCHQTPESPDHQSSVSQTVVQCRSLSSSASNHLHEMDTSQGTSCQYKLGIVCEHIVGLLYHHCPKWAPDAMMSCTLRSAIHDRTVEFLHFDPLVRSAILV